MGTKDDDLVAIAPESGGERHDAEHTHSDVSKAQELLGYEPTTSIREGVGQFIEWYRENRDWYEPLVLES